MTQTIDETLAERGNRYGEFVDHASVTQAIKMAMSTGENWECCLNDDQKECLEMIAHKMGRILNGDPDYIDSWTDIIGYARLVEKRLIAEQVPPADLKARAKDIESVRNAAEGQPKTKEPSMPFGDIAEALGVLLRAGIIRQTDDEDDES